MAPGKTIITGMILLTLAAGCTKKKVDRDSEFTSTTKTATASTPASSKDIFDEFYQEDTTASLRRKQVQSEPARSEPVVRSTAGPAPSFSENGRFVVQVSTQPSRLLADAVCAKFSAKGYPAYVAEVSNPTPALSGTFYRVRIGGFTSVALARSFGENHLKVDGCDFWVDNRSNDNVGLNGSGMGSGGGSFYGTETTSTSEFQSSYQSPPAYEPTPDPTPASAPDPAPASAPVVESASPAATTTDTSSQSTSPASGAVTPSTGIDSEWGSSSDW